MVKISSIFVAFFENMNFTFVQRTDCPQRMKETRWSQLWIFFRPLHQRGPPLIRNKNPYPEFHGKEAEIYQPQTRYQELQELPRLAPPREEFRDTGM